MRAANVFPSRLLSLTVALMPILLFSVEAFARAGGGRNEKCGLLCIILYPFILIYGVYVSYRINKKKKQISAALEEMARIEPQWSEANLLKISKEKFLLLQAAWGQQDLGLIKAHLHQSLYPLWETQIKDQQSRGEKNIMAGLSIKSLRIVDVQNYRDDERDEFTVAFDASADDQTIRGGNVISSNQSSFREFWTFEWEKSEWTLKEVTQAKGWKRFVNSAIVFENKSSRKAG